MSVLPAIDGHFSQRRTAQWLLAQAPGTVLLYADYEDMSSLQFYLGRKLPIVDCKSDDLAYAWSTDCDPSVFISSSEMLKMSGKQCLLLLACNQRPGECMTGFSDVFRMSRRAPACPPPPALKAR